MSRHARGGAETRRGRCEMRNMRVRESARVAIGEHEAAIPVALVSDLRRLARGLKAPLSSVLLAAHAKVLGALSGEPDVCTGYAVAADRKSTRLNSSHLVISYAVF